MDARNPNSYQVDVQAQELLKQLALVSPNAEGFSFSEGLIKQNGKFWVGANIGLQTKLIHAFHATPVGGHSSVQ